MNSASYEKLRSISRGKFSPQQFLQLKELATNTVGVNNSIFDVELNSLLSLYKSLVKELDTIEKEIQKLIEEVHPHYMSIPGIGPEINESGIAFFEISIPGIADHISFN